MPDYVVAATAISLDAAAIIAAVSGLTIGVLGYRRGMKKDTATASLLQFAEQTEYYGKMLKDSRDQVHFIRNESQKTIAEVVLHSKASVEAAIERHKECQVREKVLEARIDQLEERTLKIENGNNHG